MQSKASEARQQLIDRLEKRKKKFLSKLEEEFLRTVVLFMVTELTTKDGVIENTIANIVKLDQLERLRAAFEKKHVEPVLKWFASSIKKILDANKDYYDDIKKSSSAYNAAKSRAFARVGITDSGVKRTGLIRSAGNTSKAFNAVKAVGVRMISSKVGPSKVKEEIKRYVLDKEPITKEVETKTSDMFSIVDRDIGNNYRKALGLRFAIWQGGLIKTSRPICVKLNNTVVTIDELEALRNKNFEGKSDPYDPYTDCGGHNCRHQLDWISDELAFTLRPDLKDAA